MLAVLAHRGPDAEATHREPGIALGFRRLTIIDPATGMQPLANEDETVWLVVNGEIYNYQELRRDLGARGHRFRTVSDSETIVHAYEEWGEGCPEKLRGIFAFAIWDRPRGQLFLARDRSGVKPLYLWRRPGELRFASEAKALLLGADVPRRLDVVGCLGRDVVDPDFERTAFLGIQQLGPGCSLAVTAEKEQPRRFWRYEPTADLEPMPGQSEAGLVEALREELVSVVRMQVMSDVPIGAYLSGGVDSAAVVALMKRSAAEAFPTYTTVFDDDRSRDPEHAALCARQLGLRGRFVRCATGPNTLSMLPYIAWMSEGDFDLGYVARYLLARRARADGVKVVLTGQGIDEILTGYYPDFPLFLRMAAEAAIERDARDHVRRQVFSLLTDRVLREEIAETEPVVVRDRLRIEHARLSRYLLRFEDRMGMAAGVEVRVPLLDHRILELCARIPHRWRDSLLSGKRILRQAVEPWLPQEIAWRPKHAFNLNTASFSQLLLAERRSPPSRASRGRTLGALLSRETIAEKGYFDPDRVAFLQETNAYRALDRILVVHLLDDLFVQGRGLGAPLPEPRLRIVQLPEPEGRAESQGRIRPASKPARVSALSPADVPRFSTRIAGVRTFHPVDPASRGINPPVTVFVHFTGPADPALPLPGDPDTLRFLQLVDGTRSYRSIARELRGRVALRAVLAFAQILGQLGVLEPGPAAASRVRRGPTRRHGS